MTTVDTALGRISTGELGPTLMHEHIVTRSPGVHENWSHLFDRAGILAIAERKMADLHDRGIHAIVGLTTVVVLSHDANCWNDMLSEDDKRRTRPRWHYTHISDDILPALGAARVSEDQIEQMLVRNPRAIFDGAGR
jgi:predicted metal-dependent phosphotriesterase family hydrolase